MYSKDGQRGAVSLFVVMFSMLIITVATVSFLRIMVNDQRQAGDSDLSRSAYDSAMAGTEDAKRALLRYQRHCTASPSTCADAKDIISSSSCNVGVLFGEDSTINKSTPNRPEVLIKQNEGDQLLNQAYTCVTMQLETSDYIGELLPGESKLVPLVGTEGFTKVTLKWFTKDDMESKEGAVSQYSGVSSRKIPGNATEWGGNTPSLLRAQLIQFGSSFTLQQFDTTSGGQSNSNAAFLYPTKNASGVTSMRYSDYDHRASDSNPIPAASSGPVLTRCSASVSEGGYACSMTINLPEPVGSGDRTAFLRLTPHFNKTHFQVTLGSDTGSVRFKDVQPEVDSTGRANDLFRRVLSRVDLYDTSFPYPDASVDVRSGNFCKDFSVTDTQYIAGSCTP